jgi:hypothetical protein
MNGRLRLCYRLHRKAVECPHDPQPAVHLYKFDRSRSHLTRPGRTQIKPLAMSGGSVKSRCHRAAQYYTQRCLLGLQAGSSLDEPFLNVDHHREGQNDPSRHPISTEVLILSLKRQLDENIDRCIPLGNCGSYGAPFKLKCRVRSHCHRQGHHFRAVERNFTRSADVRSCARLKDQLYLYFWDPLTGPKFTFCMAVERSAISLSWAGAVRAPPRWS